jgi:hypothetical protein
MALTRHCGHEPGKKSPAHHVSDARARSASFSAAIPGQQISAPSARRLLKRDYEPRWGCANDITSKLD